MYNKCLFFYKCIKVNTCCKKMERKFRRRGQGVKFPLCPALTTPEVGDADTQKYGFQTSKRTCSEHFSLLCANTCSRTAYTSPPDDSYPILNGAQNIDNIGFTTAWRFFRFFSLFFFLENIRLPRTHNICRSESNFLWLVDTCRPVGRPAKTEFNVFGFVRGPTEYRNVSGHAPTVSSKDN